jgi:hypothetical protein
LTEVQPGVTEPALLERGRHAITGMADGSWVITRAGPLCDRCSECGCGEQQEPITIPSFAVSMLMMDPEKRAKLNPVAMLKRMMNGARDIDGTRSSDS